MRLRKALKVIQGQLVMMNIVHVLNVTQLRIATIVIAEDRVVSWDSVRTVKVHGVLHALPQTFLINVSMVVDGDDMEWLHVIADRGGQLSAAQVKRNIIALILRLEGVLSDECVRVEKIRLALSFDSGKGEGQHRNVGRHP